MSKGHVTQVTGPVVDVKYDDSQLPDIYNAITIQLDETDVGQEGRVLTLEVALHLGDNAVRTIAMSSTDGVKRGMDVSDKEGPIAVPVGDVTIGRIFNVLGETIDHGEEVAEDNQRDPIHREAPLFEDLSTETVILETGIKVVDLLAPYIK